MSKPRVHLRLDGKLLTLLEASAREQATSKTAVLEEALGHYFSKERDLTLEDRLIKRMDTLETRLGRLEWKSNLGIEMLGFYLEHWLVRALPLPKSDREFALARGRKWFNRFMDRVAERMGTRRTLARDSLHWEGEEAE
jgi:hypothetical protein